VRNFIEDDFEKNTSSKDFMLIVDALRTILGDDLLDDPIEFADSDNGELLSVNVSYDTYTSRFCDEYDLNANPDSVALYIAANASYWNSGVIEADPINIHAEYNACAGNEVEPFTATGWKNVVEGLRKIVAVDAASITVNEDTKVVTGNIKQGYYFARKAIIQDCAC
jgi:hypothetical protein